MPYNFTYADLCAGIGGFRYALNKLGGQCLYSCDIDTDCEGTYIDNYGEKYNHYNIHTVDENAFPNVDIICAGFPCQPFSLAGKKKGFEDLRSSVLLKIISITKNQMPKVLFLENVSNLVKINNGQIFKEIKTNLENLGYSVYFEILDSANFGIPQSRPRVYIVCIRNNINSSKFSFTKKKYQTIGFRKFLKEGDYSIPISSKWQEYIDLYTGQKKPSDISFQIPKTRLKLERIDVDANLNDCIFQIRSSGIRALSIDKPLPTFAVSVSGGGAMIPVYSKERRHLSLIEMKRLMGYPDSFIFNVSRTNAIKQLANSVCPAVIESIANDFLKVIY